MKGFSGKVAAITGAGSGMGRSLAVELARRGCAVALADVSETGLAGTAALCAQHDVRQRVFPEPAHCFGYGKPLQLADAAAAA